MTDYIIKSAPFAISVLNEDERLVEGFLGDDKVDIDGHMIDKMAYIKAIEDYVKWGNIREMHNAPVGVLVSHGEKAWNHIVVKIVDDRAWNLVKAGVYKGFSIGGRVLSSSWVNISQIPVDWFSGLPDIIKNAIKEVGKVLQIDSILLNEISIVDRPANPRALILAYKSIDSGEEYIKVSPEVLAAQDMYYKGVTKMDEQTVIANEAQETVEKAAPVEEVVAVTEDTVAEEIVEKNVDETEVPVEVIEIVVETETETEKSLETEAVVDYSVEIQKLSENFGQLEKSFGDTQASMAASIAEVQEQLSVLTGIVKSLTSQEEAAVEETEPVEVVEASAEPTIEKTVSNDAPNYEDIISKAVESAIAKYVKTVETNHDRQNVINAGDVEKSAESVEQEEQDNFGGLNTKQKYNRLAQAIAQSFN